VLFLAAAAAVLNQRTASAITAKTANNVADSRRFLVPQARA
jgi:hypothetical protein